MTLGQASAPNTSSYIYWLLYCLLSNTGLVQIGFDFATSKQVEQILVMHCWTSWPTSVGCEPDGVTPSISYPSNNPSDRDSSATLILVS